MLLNVKLCCEDNLVGWVKHVWACVLQRTAHSCVAVQQHWSAMSLAYTEGIEA